MYNYCLSCCSTADLSIEHFKRRNIRYVCFHFTLDGIEYLDDLGVTISPEELFNRMAHGAQTQTSQVSVEEYIAHFESILKENKDILHVTLSSGLTGTYNSACLAKEELSSKYPDRKIYIVDSLGASSGYGLIMETLADLRDEGMSIDELYHWAEDNKLRMHHWFFSTDLSFYIRGGRISKTAGTIGTILNICPLLNMDCHGHLTPREKIRGKKKVMKRIVEQMLSLPFHLSGRCKRGCLISGSAISKASWKGRNLSYWYNDWKSYRTRNSCTIFLGKAKNKLVISKKGLLQCKLPF